MTKETAAQEPLLDDEQIEMLTDMGDGISPELLVELLELFEAETTAKLDELKADLDQVVAGGGDIAKVAASAHSIAGSSANVGAKRLWAFAKALEKSAEEGSASESATIFADLVALYEESVLAIKKLISEL